MRRQLFPCLFASRLFRGKNGLLRSWLPPFVGLVGSRLLFGSLALGDIGFEVKEVFQFQLERIGDSSAALNCWGVDAALDQADEINRIVGSLRELLLREATPLPERKYALAKSLT